MAIKPRMFRTPVVKEFTDRTESRKAFWARYDKMIQEGSVIISFYGSGGVGKTALFKKLEEEVNQYHEILKRYYVKYDFSIGTDVRDILKTFKFQLSDYGCEFPLFDIGNYYYSLTIGQDIEPPKVQSMFEQLPLVQEIKKKLSTASSTAGNALAVFNTTKKFLNVAIDAKGEHWLEPFLKTTISGLANSMPIMRTITLFMSAADIFLEEYMKRNGLFDENHQFIRNELNDRRQKKDPVALYEYLPTLFAMDVADWLTATGNKLIVFLDNYESLAGATNFMSPEQRKRDLWLRGDDGLIYNIPNTLWTIAGRNELCWDGELADELEQHRITELSAEDSSTYLKKAGISDKKLCDGLVELTNGYPIFLDLCVDVYVEYKRQHNNDSPPLEEFGQKREEVVGRIFRYLDAANDDAAKDMLAFFCVLNVWTDEIAYDIGGAALHNFSSHTCERVKNFSFINSGSINNGELKLKIFQLDKTIQSLLIATCNEKFIADVKTAANDYFKKIFKAKKVFDAKEIFYLKLWAEFIVRYAVDAESLTAQYKEFLSEHVLTLTNAVHFDAAEKILMLFMNKLENFGVTETLPYTYFEMDFGRLLRARGKYNEACNVTRSAYEKRARILGEAHGDTVEAMHRLAISLNDLGCYEEAIKFHRQVLAFRKNSLGEAHGDTVEAMHRLATSLNNFGQYAEALDLREKVLAFRKNSFGEAHPDTLNAMNNLATSRSDFGQYDKALELREKVLALSKIKCGEEHPNTLDAMNNLALSLSNLKRFDDALKLQEKVLRLYEKVFGEEHPHTLDAMNNLALSLRNLKRFDDALKLQEKVLRLYENILGKKHPNTLIAMNNLTITLSDLQRHDEALELQKELFLLSKKFFGEEYPNTIAVMNNLAMSLSLLERYEEALPLQEQVLNSYKEIFGEENPYVITAMSNLALSFTILKRYDEALPLREKILSSYEETLGEENSATLNAAYMLAYVLNKSGRHEEAIALQKNILVKCDRNFADNYSLILAVVKDLSEILLKTGQREEAFQLIERVTISAKQIFGAEHSKTKEILELREEILNRSEQ